MVDVKTNCPRLGKRYVSVPKCRNLAQRMNGVDLGRVWHNRHERVWHPLFVTGDADDPDVVALRCPDDLKLWHCMAPSSVSDGTTHEKSRIDGSMIFFK